MAQYAFHFDSAQCTGCKTCQVVCKENHKLPTDSLWRRVVEYQGGILERRCRRVLCARGGVRL